MDRRLFLQSATIAALALTRSTKAQEQPLKNVNEQLEALRQAHGFPGIAAAAVRGDRIVAEGVAGVRRIGQDDKITPDDRFGMASCTKKMTAAMILRLIDSGRLAFDTTLADALPGLTMKGDYRTVTVAQLLLFTGGIQPYMQVNPMLLDLKGSPLEQREQFIKHLLQEEPIVKPGTEARYSNASYALAGFVAERRTGKTWETLMQEELFQPLSMATAGFGIPRTKDRPDEPTLHTKTDTGYEPEADDRTNALAVLAPAGNVHCSIRDFARFASYELSAAQGKNTLVKPKTAQRWQELSQSAPRLQYTKSDGGKGPPGIADGPKKKKSNGQGGKRPPDAAGGRPFFGGSPFISTCCIVWPAENLAVVAAINAGFNNDAIRAAFDSLKQAVADQSR
jgi:CubicO group peptidase (beta-lactamase class C family)